MPGTILKDTKDGFIVSTNDYDVEILEVQPSGRKRMPAFQFIENNQSLIGQVFGVDNDS